MTSSVTRTISVAMIVLELNGHLSHAVPLMVCVLTSYATSEYLKPQSFFEMLADFSGLSLKTTQKDQIIVKDLLEVKPDLKEMEYLSLHDSTYQEMIRLVKLYCSSEGEKSTVNNTDEPLITTFKLRYVPVVDSNQNMNLLFLIKLDELKVYIEEYIGPIDAFKEKSLALKN